MPSQHRLASTHAALLLLLIPFNGLISRKIWVSWYLKDKTSLDLNEARDDEILECSGISWTICKQFAPRSRQITTTSPHHSIFTGQMHFPTSNHHCQSTKACSTKSVGIDYYTANSANSQLLIST